MKSTVAAFDFDGTLTYHDTLMPFLRYCRGDLRTLWNLCAASPRFALGLMQGLPRQALKECILTQFFGGELLSHLKNQGAAFAANVLPSHIKPEGLQRLRWHQSQGHRCVLVSATLDVFLVPWAESVGFDHILSSRLVTDGNGIVTGRLVGNNCWGPEKVRRLEELLGPRAGYTLYAYGDSRGDQEMLAFADYPFHKTMPEKSAPCAS